MDSARLLTKELQRPELLSWLLEADETKLEELYAAADRVRREAVGDDVHLRGLVEISNHCVRQCHYCGIRKGNDSLERYRMSQEEILDCARLAVRFGYGTVVLQAGEDHGLTADWISTLVRRIRQETPLAVTLSLGERKSEDLAAWREAGANRYLLRFETSNKALFASIHPPLGSQPSDRLALLAEIKRLGYEVGSGVMIGIPGQRYADLAADIECFRELDLDMIGVGPFIAHPATLLGQLDRAPGGKMEADPEQVPNTEQMTYKVLALSRLVSPHANIPSTTALATLNLDQGRELGLCRGANIVMPNLTPTRYRALYEIYPDKACMSESADQCLLCLKGRIASIGRRIGVGPGESPNFRRRVGSKQ